MNVEYYIYIHVPARIPLYKKLFSVFSDNILKLFKRKRCSTYHGATGC